MGFGLGGGISVPKVEIPKVEVPKIDPAAALGGAAGGIGGAAAGIKAGVTGGLTGGLAGAVGGAAGALGAAAKSALSLKSVAGALAEVAVSFKGGTTDFAMEPHMVLDANASYGDTQFEKGPIWIRVDLTPDKAKANTDTVHITSDSGGYDKKLKISEFTEKSDKTVDILFEDAPMDAKFALEVISASGSSHSIFTGVPYGDLRKTKNRV